MAVSELVKMARTREDREAHHAAGPARESVPGAAGANGGIETGTGVPGRMSGGAFGADRRVVAGSAGANGGIETPTWPVSG